MKRVVSSVGMYMVLLRGLRPRFRRLFLPSEHCGLLVFSLYPCPVLLYFIAFCEKPASDSTAGACCGSFDARLLGGACLPSSLHSAVKFRSIVSCCIAIVASPRIFLVLALAHPGPSDNNDIVPGARIRYADAEFQRHPCLLCWPDNWVTCPHPLPTDWVDRDDGKITSAHLVFPIDNTSMTMTGSIDPVSSTKTRHTLLFTIFTIRVHYMGYTA